MFQRCILRLQVQSPVYMVNFPKVVLFVLPAMVLLFAGFTLPKRRVDPCKLYGRIYVEKNRAYADVRIFVDETEGLADLVVYRHENMLYADKNGQWYFTQNRMDADYWIYLEENRGMADLIVAYTETESFAGCTR